MKPIPFLESGCTNSRKGQQLEIEYRQNEDFEWPVQMGVATPEEIQVATVDELDMYILKANKKYELLSQLFSGLGQ